jgi:hypothetical protein
MLCPSAVSGVERMIGRQWRVLIGAGIVSVVICGSSQARERRPELLPAAMAQRAAQVAALTRGNKENPETQRQWLNQRRWRPGDVVRVCFMPQTDAGARARVAAIANQWNGANATVRLSFGSLSSPRVCSQTQASEVRVAFNSGDTGGDWSLVARESLDPRIVAPDQPSMNIEIRADRPLDSREFNGIVLHEFGHALGLLHEHQHPLARCESEFNLDVVYRVLAAPPFNWSRADIDYNIRLGGGFEDVVMTQFDRRSIMLYSFPASYYRRGVSSACYHAPNYTISTGDREALRQAYGALPAQIAKAKTPPTIAPPAPSPPAPGAPVVRRDRVEPKAGDRPEQVQRSDD